MFEYIELGPASTDRFLQLFGEEISTNGYLDNYASGRFVINSYLGTAYNKLFSVDSDVKERYNEIVKRDKDHADIFFAAQPDMNMANPDKILGYLSGGDRDTNQANVEAYKEAFLVVLDHLKRNFIKLKRRDNRYYQLEPTPMSFYEYKGYNDNTPPD